MVEENIVKMNMTLAKCQLFHTYTHMTSNHRQLKSQVRLYQPKWFTVKGKTVKISLGDGRVFVSHVSGRGLVSKIHEAFL